MPVLELSVDASGVQSGLARANRALEETGQKAKATSSVVQTTGNNLNAAFAATGGGLSVTRGLVSIGDGFRSANIGMATFAASQALLDLGRFSADMRSVGESTGAAGSALGRIGSIIKANPLLTIATVLAGAATAMSLFGSKTKDAKKELQDAGKIASEFRSSISGIASARVTGTGRAQAIQQLLNRVRSEDLTRNLEFGEPQIGANLGNGQQYAYLRQVDRVLPGIFNDIRRSDSTDPFGSDLPRGVFDRNKGAPGGRQQDTLISRERLLEYLDTELGKERQTATNAQDRVEQEARRIFIQEKEESNRLELEQKRQDQAREAMDQLIQQGREFGATVGDAFFNVASGAATARQAIAQIVSDLARATSRQAFASLFGSVAGSFGRTGTQAANNVPTGEMAP